MKVAVSWSGGKDSFLACYEVLSQRHDVSYLVTFVLDGWPAMQHPLSIMDLQSKAMGIPHKIVRLEVGTRSYRELYEEAILDLIKNEEIEGIVTGDIHVIDVTHGHWMDTVCQGLDIEVITTLWGRDSYQILNQEISLGLKAIFTHVKRPWFDEEWLGRELDSDSLKDLKRLAEPAGRMAIIDGQSMLMSLTDDKDVHETQDVALWATSEHAVNSMAGPLFTQLWGSAK